MSPAGASSLKRQANNGVSSTARTASNADDDEVQIVSTKKVKCELNRIELTCALAPPPAHGASLSLPVAPIFARQSHTSPAGQSASDVVESTCDGSIKLPVSLPSKIKWVTSGNKDTCLIGTYGEPAAAAIARLQRAPSTSSSPAKVTVAMFDLDWTLVKPTGNKVRLMLALSAALVRTRLTLLSPLCSDGQARRIRTTMPSCSPAPSRKYRSATSKGEVAFVCESLELAFADLYLCQASGCDRLEPVSDATLG